VAVTPSSSENMRDCVVRVEGMSGSRNRAAVAMPETYPKNRYSGGNTACAYGYLTTSYT